MKMLLENGANIACVSSEESALDLAIALERIDVVREILKSGQNEQHSWRKCEGGRLQFVGSPGR